MESESLCASKKISHDREALHKEEELMYETERMYVKLRFTTLPPVRHGIVSYNIELQLFLFVRSCFSGPADLAEAMTKTAVPLRKNTSNLDNLIKNKVKRWHFCS